jgi:hypothetical protein
MLRLQGESDRSSNLSSYRVLYSESWENEGEPNAGILERCECGAVVVSNVSIRVSIDYNSVNET